MNSLKYKLSNILFDIKYYTKKLILDISYFIYNSYRYRDILKKDADWDYYFLLKFERRKLEFMKDYFKTSNLTESDKEIYKEINLALKLLDIYLEYDNSKDKYVNTKNASRFFTKGQTETLKRQIGENNIALVYYFYTDLRKNKAWCIYNKLRTEKIEKWWN